MQGEITLFGSMAYRFVEVEELPDYRLVIHVVGYGTEAVILRYACHIVLAVVLTQSFGVPCDAFLHIASVKTGLVYNLVERSAYSDEFFFLFHVLDTGFRTANIISAAD